MMIGLAAADNWRGNMRYLDAEAECLLFMAILMLHVTLDVDVDVDGYQDVLVRIPCNGAEAAGPWGRCFYRRIVEWGWLGHIVSYIYCLTICTYRLLLLLNEWTDVTIAWFNLIKLPHNFSTTSEAVRLINVGVLFDARILLTWRSDINIRFP